MVQPLTCRASGHLSVVELKLAAMTVPDAATLLGRKKYGREEYVQDILAALIVGGDPPRWNVRTTPTARGSAFVTDVVNLAMPGWSGQERRSIS